MKLEMTALGLSLVLIGVVVALVEAHWPAHGLIGIPAVACLAAGAVLAVTGLGAGVVVGLFVALALAGTAAALGAVTVSKSMAVRGRRVRTGPEAMIGRVGTVARWERRNGSVLIDGGRWRARLTAGAPDDELAAGDEIVIEHVSGLMLSVRRAEEWELAQW
jgi:membrane-bound ClpP family serine protease